MKEIAPLLNALIIPCEQLDLQILLHTSSTRSLVFGQQLSKSEQIRELVECPFEVLTEGNKLTVKVSIWVDVKVVDEDSERIQSVSVYACATSGITFTVIGATITSAGALLVFAVGNYYQSPSLSQPQSGASSHPHGPGSRSRSPMRSSMYLAVMP